MNIRRIFFSLAIATCAAVHSPAAHASLAEADYVRVGFVTKMKEGAKKVSDSVKGVASKMKPPPLHVREQRTADRQAKKLKQLAANPETKAKAEKYLSKKAGHGVQIGPHGNLIHKPHQSTASKIGAPSSAQRPPRFRPSLPTIPEEHDPKGKGRAD